MQPLQRTLRFITQHPLTSDRPAAALARFVGWQVKSRLRTQCVVEWIDGAKLVVRRGMTGATGNIYCGLHEFTDMAFLIHMLREDDLFVDVGANIGSYTVLGSKVCRAKVLAIEPDPGSIKSLMLNLHENRIEESVRVEATAVGSEAGFVQFTTGLDTMNQVAVTPCSEVRTRQVPITTLDTLLHEQDPTMMKLDIEGGEAEALRGAKATLANPSLLAVETESNDTSVKETLKSSGFTRVFYSPFDRQIHVTSQGVVTQGNNHLYVRDPARCQARVAEAPRRKILNHDV